MAIVPMKHIEIIAMQSDAKKVVDFLQRIGTVDVTERFKDDEDESVALISTQTSIAQFDKSLQTVKRAIELIEQYGNVKHSLLEGFMGRKELSAEEFAARTDCVEKTMRVAYEIEALDRKIASEKTVRIHTENRLDQILPWENLDVPMQFQGTAKAPCAVGQLPFTCDEAALKKLFDDKYIAYMASNAATRGEDFAPENISIPDFYVEIISVAREQTCLFIMAHKAFFDDIMYVFRNLGFVAPSDPTKHPPAYRIAKLRARIEESAQTILDCRDKMGTFSEELDNLYFLSDYMLMRKDKYEMLGQVLFSQKTFILDGFIAESDCEPLCKELEENFTLYVECRDPRDDEEVPIKFKNNAFAAPVEDIVEGYSAPSKNDLDPNPVMSFFYYLFFGMMLSDAGYGLLMIIGTLFILLKLKPEGATKQNMRKFLYCGISSTFWGFLFGSFFGNVVQAISTGFFDGSVSLKPIWFDPAQNPMFMLGVSLVLGFIHLMAGLALKFVNMWKHGDRIGACFDVGFWWVGFAGLILVIIPMLVKTSLPLAEIGKYVAIAGALGLVCTQGRKSPTIIGKIIGGLGSLYNVTGYFSDILSYSRLMALGLVTGIVGMVANTIGTIFLSGIGRLIIFIIVFVVLHTVNMGISALGAYVHGNRLEYVEFFGKFYEGGGTMFHPFKMNTKHYKYKEDK